MAVINTNITSLIGQQNLNKSASALQTAMERLSSGSRINSAKDDAAGQAIANRMSSQITGLSQAQRNANDGISVAQTAEGALNQINDNLQRVRELTVQAQNETNSADDLTSIQNEIGQRLNEINRISEETSFNGVKVLQEDNSLKIQVGANDDETISIDLEKINAETLGVNDFRVASDQKVTLDQLTDDFGAQQATRANYAGASNLYSDDGTTAAGDQVININSEGMAINGASDDAVYAMDDGNFSTDSERAAIDATGIVGTGNVAAAGWTETTARTGTEDGVYSTTLEDGRVLTATVTAGATDAATGTSVSYQIDGDNFTGTIYAKDGAAGDGFTVVKEREQATEADLEASALERTDATYNVTSASYSVDIKGNVSQNDTAVYASVDANGDPALVLEGEQRAKTEDPLAALDSALSSVDALRSDLGAIQNRFDSAITNLSTTTTNLSAARSRIEDADYAVEVSNMTRAQILQQAGTSVLAQANQVPQGVLSLLQ